MKLTRLVQSSTGHGDLDVRYLHHKSVRWPGHALQNRMTFGTIFVLGSGILGITSIFVLFLLTLVFEKKEK